MIVEAISPGRFQEWVDRRRVAVVFLGDGPSTPRSSTLVRGFDLVLREAVSVGWMSRSASKDLSWWMQNWRTRLGPCDTKAVPGAGIWLFVDGFVAGFHPHPRDPQAIDAWTGARTYLLDRIRLKMSSTEDETAWTRRAPDPPPKAEAPREPAAPRPVPTVGPYALLEISPDTPDAELRSAFLTAIKLNHPDRVAHLSTAIQDFAKERTQRILEAWSAIKRERNLS